MHFVIILSVLYDDNFILAADRIHDRIIQVDLESGNLVKIPVKVVGVTGVAYEKSTGTIFYTTSKDLFSARVGSISLRGDRDRVTYATGFQYSESLALDHSTGNVFFAAVMTPGQDFIRVIHRKLLLQKTLLENLDRPRSIALFSSKGLIFWTEVKVERIGKAFMDGTSKKYIITNKIRWPNGVAIDFTAERLYWTDGFNEIVESSDLNGGDRRVVYNDKYAHLRSIAIDEQFIYYTGYNRQRIMKVDKTSERRTKFMDSYPELNVLVGLQVYSNNYTIDVNPLCSRNNGLCSTFCFPTPTGRTCGCQDNTELLSDQKTCEGVSVCPTSLTNLQLLDCGAYSGRTCEFECKNGLHRTNNISLKCNALGLWEPDPDSICIELLCPSILLNAVLDFGCTRRIGEACKFICKENYIPLFSENIVCSEKGVWRLQNSTEFCTTKTPTTQTSNDSLIAWLGTVASLTLVAVIIIIVSSRKRKNLSGEESERRSRDTASIPSSTYHQQNNVYITNSGRSSSEYDNLDEMMLRYFSYMEFDGEYYSEINNVFNFDSTSTS